MHGITLLRLTGLLLAVATAVAPASAADAAKPAFLVSTTAMGTAGGTLSAAEWARSLAAGNWCTAEVAGKAVRWNVPPAGAPPAAWVSVVLAGYGTQAHAFAFMFNGPDGTPRLLAHVPYTQSWQPGGSFVWIPPSARLAAAFREAYQRPPVADAPPRVALKEMTWERAAGDEPTGGRGADGGPSEAAATVSAADGLPALGVMLAAAACENGWTPCWTEADTRLGLEVRFGFKKSAMRLTRQTGTARNSERKDDIPEAQYYAFLYRLVYGLHEEGRAGTFAWLGAGPVDVLAATPKHLCATVDGVLMAYDPLTGKRLWPAIAEKPPARKPPPELYTTRPAAGSATGAVQVYRYSGGLLAIDAATGAAKALAPVAPAAPWAFAVGADQTTVLAQGAAIHAYRNNTPLWKADAAADVVVGPLLLGTRVYAGTAAGEILCLALETGAPQWQKQVSPAWHGPLAGGGDRIMGMTTDDNELVAITAADGTALWRLPVGDVLLGAPLPLGDRTLVAGKNNRLLVFNPADGRTAQETRWPTWLLDVIALPGNDPPRLLCSDLGRRLSVVDGATLKPLRALRLPAPLSGGLVFAPAFPAAWAVAAEEDGLESGADALQPTVLLGDVEGFCYLVPVK